MREHSLHDLLNVILVLVAKLENDILVLRPTTRKEALHFGILAEQTGHHMQLASFGTLGVKIEDLQKGSHGDLEKLGIARCHILVHELLEGLVQGPRRELGSTGLRAVDDLGELRVELLRYPGVKRGELSSELAVRQLRVPQHLDQLLQSLRHDDLVVEALEDVLQDVVGQREALRGLVADNNWSAVLGQLTEEGLRLLDTAGVIQSEYTQDVAGLECGTRLLNQLYDAVLLCNQRHVHLHDLDFGECLSGAHVLAVLDGVLDQLAGAGRPQLSRVVLLFKETRAVVDRNTGCADLFLPVNVVTPAIKQHKKAAITEGADTDSALGAVDEEMVAVHAGPGDGELVPVSFVDEIDRKDGLQDILGRHLTLLQACAVFAHACFAQNVRLGDGTTDHSKHGVGALGSKLLGDQLV